MRQQSCVICGHTGPEVRVLLIAWADPDEGHPFDASPRCPDATACRARVEQQGERWPVRELRRTA